MSLVVAIDQASEPLQAHTGGKARSLARLAHAGLPSPGGLVVTRQAYDAMLAIDGLGERIWMELGRTQLEQARWEALWDSALRIRSLFLRARMPEDMRAELERTFTETFSNRPVAVRSSSLLEDSPEASFAGLHESYLGISGAQAIIDHVRLVWASLWSNRALLYRRELGLDVAHSAMAVIVQELQPGSRSGVAFGSSPGDPGVAVIEAVWGLCQGLVDGSVEPDRWTLDRSSGAVLTHNPVPRTHWVTAGSSASHLAPLPAGNQTRAPLTDAEVQRLWQLYLRVEETFGSRQDVEWTWTDQGPVVLQARPLTTGPKAGDERSWYLSLQDSFERLTALQERIEQDHMPGMAREADTLSAVDLAGLDAPGLAEQVLLRRAARDRWHKVYWDELIPFAHGVRLFGQVYNDRLRPQDPYAFTELLTGGPLAGMDRNASLARLAQRLRQDPQLAQRLEQSLGDSGDPGFEDALSAYMTQYGDQACRWTGCQESRATTAALLLRLARLAAKSRPSADRGDLEAAYLAAFNPQQQDFAQELLALARASWRLRDDDNLALGRIEVELERAVSEVQSRLAAGLDIDILEPLSVGELEHPPDPAPADPDQASPFHPHPRQLVGHPAGPGSASGRARVIKRPEQIWELEAGEVLVCDALDPNMTFAAPLATAVVERRGGMLIHGAIIARELGIPCVTGVAAATERILTGDELTVDGHMGIVVVHATQAT